MIPRLTAFVVTLALAAMTSSANAAIWAWGCKGRFDNTEVVFNRDFLALVTGKPVKMPLKTLVLGNDPVSDDPDAIRFNPDDINGGLERKMTFTQQDDKERKVTMAEKTSRKLSSRSGRAGPRDETWTTWKKIYRFTLGKDAPRDLAMDCGEYTLSTKGGRG